VKSLHNESASLAARSAALDGLWGLAILLGDGMRGFFTEYGLTLARSEVLWHLAASGALTQRALSRMLRVTPRNVTGLIDGLEADGFVARTVHPSDRRATLVALTEKGTAVTTGMREGQALFAQGLFEDVTPAELATFAKIVELVRQRVDELLAAAQKPPAGSDG
jgi:DNA-binding MarR family transcriptional regulator